jgi:hypothetical protein
MVGANRYLRRWHMFGRCGVLVKMELAISISPINGPQSRGRGVSQSGNREPRPRPVLPVQWRARLNDGHMAIRDLALDTQLVSQLLTHPSTTPDANSKRVSPGTGVNDVPGLDMEPPRVWCDTTELNPFQRISGRTVASSGVPRA